MSNATAERTDRDLLKVAVRRLAGVCDGAVTEDGHGFNRHDAAFGHDLAHRDGWTPRQRRAAWKMVRKYRGQLDGMGIDWDEIPEPPDSEEETEENVTEREAKAERTDDREIVLEEDGGRFAIRFEYDPALVSAVKDGVDGRTFDPDRTLWTAPLTPLAASGLLDLADAHGFRFSQDAEREARRLAETVDALGERHVSWDADGERFLVVFRFDRRLKDDLKATVPGATWDPDANVWAAPESSHRELDAWASDAGFAWSPDAAERRDAAREERERLAEASAAANAERLPVEDRLGGELMPFQRAGVRYTAEAGRVMIADEMGLGKTIQALAVLEARDAYSAVVVCPASLKLNWAREARKWLPAERTVEVVGGTTPGETSADVTVINYAVLDAWLDALSARSPAAVILDESHLVKNGKAKRSKAARDLAAGADVRLLLTGTPVLNRPIELWHQLKVMGREKDVAGNWHRYVTRYCDGHQTRWGWDVSGASNTDELNRKLRAACYVRRLKADVLTDLPAKRRAVVPVEIDNRKEYEEARRDLIRWLRENEGRAAAGSAARAEQLARISHLKRVAADGKLDAACRWIEDFLESGEKLVVFAHHRSVQDALHRRFEDRAVRLSGDTPGEERERAVRRFQEEDGVRLFVGSLKAAGVGITLTAASNVTFVELGWTPADHDQAEDRCHRIGQEDSVTAWYLIAEDTIDEEITALLSSKRGVVDSTTDGGEAARTSVLNDLLTSLGTEEKA